MAQGGSGGWVVGGVGGGGDGGCAGGWVGGGGLTCTCFSANRHEYQRFVFIHRHI